MEKTKEMLERAENEDCIIKENYEENVMYSMRDFTDEFLDWMFDFDTISSSDGYTVLCTTYVSPITSIVVDWSVRSWFQTSEEFVDTMMDLVKRREELLDLFDSWKKWEDSTK